MDRFELAIAQLRNLPEPIQNEAVVYIEKLHEATREERLAALRITAGCLSGPDGEALEKGIRECCEQIDE